jgi:hypothetical protein
MPNFISIYIKERTGRPVTVTPCGGELEYLHRSPATRKRRQKGNPVPGGHPVPEGYKYGDLALQVVGVSDETVIQ